MSFVSGGAGRRGDCGLKRKHPTSASARDAIEALVKRGAYGPSLEVRRCKYGARDHFHVCHAMTKDRKRKR